MKRKYFYLNGKKYFNESEYIEARNKYLNYQDEQEEAFAQSGYKGIEILLGETSEVINFEKS